MTTHHRTRSVAQASADIGVHLIALQREHGLTDIEMMQAVTAWQECMLECMLRAERHPGDLDKPADEE